MRRLISSRLSTKLFLGFFLILLPPMLLSYMVMFIVVHRTIEPIAINNLLALSGQVAAEVDRTLNRALSDLENLSTDEVIQAIDVKPEKKRERMQRLQDLYPLFEDITLLDLKARVITSTTYAYRGEWKGKVWYFEGVKGKIGISRAHPIINPFKVVISLAMPVDDRAGDRRWVIVGQINMEKIWQIIDSVRIGSTGYAMIANADGSVVGHPDKEMVLRFILPSSLQTYMSTTHYGAMHIKNFNGKDEMLAFAPVYLSHDVGFPNWSVIVAQPVKELMAGVRKAQYIAIVVLIVALFLFGVLAYKILNYIIKPVAYLTAHVMGISRSGDLDRLIEPTSSDELGVLVESFNMMADRLKSTTVSRDYMDGIIHSMTDMLLVVDKEGKLKRINQAVIDNLEYDEEELLGRDIAFLFATEEDFFQTEIWKHLLAGKKVVDLECSCMTKSGKRFSVGISGASLEPKSEEKGDIVIIARDISERKKAEEIIREKLAYIKKLNELMVGREERVMEMKEEVNALLNELNRPKKYT
ncbi:MAG: cache domain-containing protein [Pseudomonadota bacterium]